MRLVSTHSRPKAAGTCNPRLLNAWAMFQHTAARRRLGRQRRRPSSRCCFNTQPPEGGWQQIYDRLHLPYTVSTHSRPKAAGIYKAGGCVVTTCFNTQPPEGGWACSVVVNVLNIKFQHTAARRRLALERIFAMETIEVSTHSRPKAAGARRYLLSVQSARFNTQPPEGGWSLS